MMVVVVVMMTMAAVMMDDGDDHDDADSDDGGHDDDDADRDYDIRKKTQTHENQKPNLVKKLICYREKKTDPGRVRS